MWALEGSSDVISSPAARPHLLNVFALCLATTNPSSSAENEVDGSDLSSPYCRNAIRYYMRAVGGGGGGGGGKDVSLRGGMGGQDPRLPITGVTGSVGANVA